jgi:hypothetical protein
MKVKLSELRSLVRNVLNENIDKTYTHFLVDKKSNRILSGWDYMGLDPESIKEYTRMDIKDMFPDSKLSEFTVVSKDNLKRKGVDPFDESNWGNEKDSLTEGYNEQTYYMFFQNIKQIKRQCEEMLSMDKNKVDEVLKSGHDWAADHISTSKDDVEEVYNFLKTKCESKRNDIDQSRFMSEKDLMEYGKIK